MKRLLAFVLALATPATAALSAGSLAIPTAAAEARGGSCGSGYYVNSRGNCVPRPRRSATVPAGASAKCRDGTYSFSQSRRGTCSHHGGVGSWL